MLGDGFSLFGIAISIALKWSGHAWHHRQLTVRHGAGDDFRSEGVRHHRRAQRQAGNGERCRPRPAIPRRSPQRNTVADVPWMVTKDPTATSSVPASKPSSRTSRPRESEPPTTCPRRRSPAGPAPLVPNVPEGVMHRSHATGLSCGQALPRVLRPEPCPLPADRCGGRSW